MFLKNSFDSTIHEIVLNKEDEAFIASVNRDLKCYIESLENIKYVSNVSFYVFFYCFVFLDNSNFFCRTM